MSMAFILIKRNIKLFFKDKGYFLTFFFFHFYQSFAIIIWLSPVYNIGGMNKNEKNFTVTLATRFVSSPFYQHQRLYRQENKSEKGCIRLKCYHKFYCSNCA